MGGGEFWTGMGGASASADTATHLDLKTGLTARGSDIDFTFLLSVAAKTWLSVSFNPLTTVLNTFNTFPIILPGFTVQTGFLIFFYNSMTLHHC